jgi:hypothetical protein
LSQGANAAERRALDKAYYVLGCGMNIVTCGGALLIPGSKGDIYRVSPDGSCNCPASGRCYHQGIADLIIEAQAHSCYTMPNLIDPPPPEPPAVGDGPGEDYPPPEYRRPLRQTAAQSASDLFG